MDSRASSILIRDYVDLVKPTDTMPPEIEPVLFGLFGEVGSVMATSKKLAREKKEVYVGFRRAAVEEFGDVLWYLAAICRRLSIDFESIFQFPPEQFESETAISATDLSGWPVAVATRSVPPPDPDQALLKLGAVAGEILQIKGDPDCAKSCLTRFVTQYLRASTSPHKRVAR